MQNIAAIQMVSTANLEENLAIAELLITKAVNHGAKLIVLPENFALMAMEDGEPLAIMEKFGSGVIQEFLSQQAKKNNVWVVGGTIPIQSEYSNKYYTACLVFDDNGQCVARYDKIHLFDVMVADNQGRYTESKHILPGNKSVVVDSPVGRLGLAVCYDLRFPELFRDLSNQGAELLVVPAAFTAVTGKAHWEILLKARAIENLCYVIGSAQGGKHKNGRETFGHSLIIDPWGMSLKQLPQGNGIVITNIDREKQMQIRDQFPVLQHRKIL